MQKEFCISRFCGMCYWTHCNYQISKIKGNLTDKRTILKE